MVLVSNEWQSNKNDEQKSSLAAANTSATPSTISTLATGEAAEAPLAVNNVSSPVTDVSLNSTEQALTARPGAHVLASIPGVSVDISKRQQRINKKTQSIMELNRKTEQEQLLLREKHGTETCVLPIENIHNSNVNSNDANDNLENNNITLPTTDSCDSNTNTLQGHMAQQQVQFQLDINSMLNSNNTTSKNLFSSMGALQMPNDTSVAVAAATTMLNSREMTPVEAKIVLQCEGKSHKFDTRTILLAQNQECKVGRLIAKSKASEGNAIFDCKVLSRNHAVLWYTADGHFWVKDTKSSNGTFINDNKLGNEPAELHYGDTVKFGVEVIENSRQEVHGCIIARVTLFLPDGREAISIESDQMQPAGPNRISYDEIQRLNAFLQEASQREKMLKAKLSNLQGVLDSTRKNSAMSWQSMITEDQLIHKINLLEKKLQMLEKSVPENVLRNEIVKLLDDKTTYQLTAKEALRKVYQDRCDAMQMLSKMEMAYTTSDNECSILRTQIVNSKQTLQDFNQRLETLQQEYADYKQESLRQKQEAKEQEEQQLEQLKEHLNMQENEMEQLRQQLLQLQQAKAEYDSEQALQEQQVLEQQVLEQLDAALGIDDNDDDDDDNDNDDDDDDEEDDDESKNDYHGQEKIASRKDENEPQIENEKQTTPSKLKSGKKNKRPLKKEFDMKHEGARKDAMLKWLKNSDLNKGADGGDVLNAIVNSADSGDEEHDEKSRKEDASPESELSAGTKQETEAETASDEFIHNSSKQTLLNGIKESTSEAPHGVHKLETQQTLVHSGLIDGDLPQEHAFDMLQEECTLYKKKADVLTNDISDLQQQIKVLRRQLLQQQEERRSVLPEVLEILPTDNKNEHLEPTIAKDVEGGESSSWREELNTINNEERDEELIVYKERWEQSEMSNLQLRDEISKLVLKQTTDYNNILYRRVLPLGAVVLAVIIYFLTTRI